jgi:hypothetical protein
LRQTGYLDSSSKKQNKNKTKKQKKPHHLHLKHRTTLAMANFNLNAHSIPGHQWLTPVILTTQEAEIRRMAIQSQPRQIVFETLSQRNPSQNRTGVVTQMHA